MRKATILTPLAFAVPLLASPVGADEVPADQIENFADGDLLEASDLNVNFEALRSAVTDNAQDLATHRSDIDANSQSINGLRSDVDDNTAAMPRIVAAQETTFTDPVTVTSDQYVEIEPLTINAGPEPVNISFQAHVVFEGNELDSSDRYSVAICKGNAVDGNVVGRGWWRPSLSPKPDNYVNLLQAQTIALTGFDDGVTGTANYSICARKNGPGDQDLNAYSRGLTATIAPQ